MIALALALLFASLGYAITAHALLLAALVWHAWRLRPMRAVATAPIRGMLIEKCDLCAGRLREPIHYVGGGAVLCPDCAGIVRGEVAA